MFVICLILKLNQMFVTDFILRKIKRINHNICFEQQRTYEENTYFKIKKRLDLIPYILRIPNGIEIEIRQKDIRSVLLFLNKLNYLDKIELFTILYDPFCDEELNNILYNIR